MNSTPILKNAEELAEEKTKENQKPENPENQKNQRNNKIETD